MAQAATPTPSAAARTSALTLRLDEVGIEDLALVGGKTASLGEMIRNLKPRGIRVPGGFAVTATAYHLFLEKGGVEERLSKLLHGLDYDNVEMLRRRGDEARRMVTDTPFPPELEAAIRKAYAAMCKEDGVATHVAVRSSATAEDLPTASFAGQQESFLNVWGEERVLDATRKCFASLFTDRALHYRHVQGFDRLRIALTVCVQKMVRSDIGASGVMFSIHTESGFKDVVVINAGYCLGENIVQGAINPDEYFVFKPTLLQGFRPVIMKHLGSKAFGMVYAPDDEHGTVNVPVPKDMQEKFALKDDDILQLARWACDIEDHYSKVRGTHAPMDMEWALDGEDGRLYLLQARPETVQSQRKSQTLESWHLLEHGATLAAGRAIGEAIGQGDAHVISDPHDLERFVKGEVLVTDHTDPDWEPIMKKAGAIVTNQGGRTCHAAIIARELGIPAIVGTQDGTKKIRTGQAITVSCAEGEQGLVYAGKLKYDVRRIALDEIPRTRTHIMMNLGNPESAFRMASLPHDGVGLARMEFIVANQIGVHPMALTHFDQVKDPAARMKIEQLTKHYSDRTDYFVEKLAEGVAMIASACYPKPVIVRLSDFKTNEYAHLIGGEQFEPVEENPMLGWRGASRYYDLKYRDGFALECRAMKRVRDEMGLTNVILMVPFCRTPEDGRKVVEQLARNGLKQGENGLQLYMMCELPSNVLLADEFLDIFDGYSIGSNDLTQLTLGLDRDSALVARLFDERNPAVEKMIAMAIAAAKRKGKKIGICGQAPSDYPEFARFLVKEGIDSMSLNPDTLVKTLLDIAQFEKSEGKT